MGQMSLIEKAIELAVHAHEGQMDEDGMPHIVHSLAVMFAVKAVCDYHATYRKRLPYTVEELMIAAVLHDVVEDTPIPLKHIEMVFGKNVAEMVDCVTRRGLGKGETKETYRDFIYRTKANAGARIIKVADLQNNSGRAHLIKSASWRKKLEYKYKIALAVLQDMDEPTWEQASWESKTEGPHTLYFVADPNGKKIEITEDEFKVMREEMKQKRLESLSRLTASKFPETITE